LCIDVEGGAVATIVDTPVTVSDWRPVHATDTEVRLLSNEPFLSEVLGSPTRFHHLSRSKLNVALDLADDGPVSGGATFDVPTVSLGVQTLHGCFATHTPFSLSPDVAWYLIVFEVAEHVRQHPERYARLFTAAPGTTQLIQVRDDTLRYDAPSDWPRSLDLVRAPLAERLTDEAMGLFVADFTTSTAESRTALLVAFMDTISPYYAFEWMTLCGIPKIRLEGTGADWTDLMTRTDELAGHFDGLVGYFADLMPVLETIADAARGVPTDEQFWRSIYKYNDSSGGPYVTGWITAFFAHVVTAHGTELKQRFDWRSTASQGMGGYETNVFPSHVSSVPFTWRYLDQIYDMRFVAGVIGVDESDGYLSPQLGFAVVEC
jgi:hypothetical protein